MRTARFLAALIFMATANAGLSRADAPHNDTSFLEFFATPPPDVPVDPDATPAAFLPAPPEITPQQRDAVIEAKRKAVENQNWMLEGYEQQLQARQTAADGQGKPVDTNLYAELSSDKELAKAAGIRPLDFTTPAEMGPRAGVDEKKPDLNLRGDSTLADLSATNSRTAPLFKPLIVPLESSAATRIEAPYALPSPISSSFSAPISFDLSPQETAEDDAAQNAVPADPGAMDIPGMTAAESNPAMREALDLSNDQAPGTTLAEEKEHHSLALELPELPEAPSTDRLEKLQDSALNLPGQPSNKKPQPPIVPFVLKPTVQPTSTMVPDPPPMRRQVADPYDILR